MKVQLIINWLSRIVLLVYILINIDFWIHVLLPTFYDKYYSKLCIYEVYNVIGVWLLFVVISLIILHINQTIKIDRKVFWIMLIVFLLNLILMYLEIKKHGDS